MEREEALSKERKTLLSHYFRCILRHLNNHILPVFGNKKMEQIKSLHIVDF
ncbi:hypothetical protein ACEQPO_09635 [Bacillus sp. SL00103]